MPPELVDFFKNIGIVGGTVAIVWILAKLAGQLIEFLKFVWTGTKEALEKFTKTLQDISDRQAAHDNQISEIDASIEEVKAVQEGAFTKLIESIDANTQLTGSTIKSYQNLEEQFVASYDSASKTIDLRALDIKKNSNDNTDRIIEELNKLAERLENPDGVLRQDLKAQTDTIKGELQSLVQERDNLKIELEIANLAKQSVEAKLAEVQSGASDKPEPLTFIMAAEQHLSPIDGAANREAIDAAKTEPTGEAK